MGLRQKVESYTRTASAFLAVFLFLCPLDLGAKFLFFIFLQSLETDSFDLKRPATEIVLFTLYFFESIILVVFQVLDLPLNGLITTCDSCNPSVLVTNSI